jgi:DHA3 family macrolide efflux protein-like MFS transporter
MTGFFSTRQTRGFLIIWTGQSLSVIGSGMTSFVLAIWTYERQWSTSQFATIVLAASLPAIVMAPFAGALIDRWNKRTTLAFAVAGQAIATGVVSLMFSTHRIETYWQIYPAIIVIAVCGSFQGPALATIGSALLPEELYSRASGLWQLNQAAVMIISPVLAVIIMPFVRIEGVILFDALSYIFAIVSLWLVHFPRPVLAGQAQTMEAQRTVRVFLQEVAAGWRYIRTRSALLQLLAYTLFLNLIYDMVQILVLPLAVKGGTPGKLASLMSLSAFGMVGGSVIMSIWKGPSRQIFGVLLSGFMVGLALLAAGPQQSQTWLALSFFAFTFFIPLGQSTGGAIWMRKSDPAVLGRVTATTSMLIQLCFPAACFVAPVLADHVVGPLLAPGGALVGGPIAAVFGVGIQRGVGLLISTMGAAAMLISVLFFMNRRFRSVEDDLPDMANRQADWAATETSEAIPAQVSASVTGACVSMTIDEPRQIETVEASSGKPPFQTRNEDPASALSRAERASNVLYVPLEARNQ